MTAEKILVIDGEPSVIELCQQALGEQGFEVKGVPTGEKGLQLLTEGDFDLILCDMVLRRLLAPVGSLRELARVMCPGGRMVVVDVVVDEATDRYVNELARLREPEHWRHYRAEEYEQMLHEAGLQATERRILRQSVDVDAWAEAGLTTPPGLDLIGPRLRSYPVDAQVALDSVYADGRASFSFDVMAVRLEAGASP